MFGYVDSGTLGDPLATKKSRLYVCSLGKQHKINVDSRTLADSLATKRRTLVRATFCFCFVLIVRRSLLCLTDDRGMCGAEFPSGLLYLTYTNGFVTSNPRHAAETFCFCLVLIVRRSCLLYTSDAADE